MKKFFLLIILALGVVLAEPVVGNAYVISALGIKNSPDNVAYVSGDTSVNGNANYVLAPQVIIYQEGLSYVGSYTPFTGCLSSKHYTNGAPDGLCITGIINDLTTGGTDKALSAEQGKVLNERVEKIEKDLIVNLFYPGMANWDTRDLNGVTVTNNHDGTFTLNGVADDNLFWVEDSYVGLRVGKIYLEAGKEYKILGCPDSEDVFIGGDSVGASSYDGKIVIKKQSGWYDVDIAIYKGAVLDNVVFKPMVTTSLDATYEDFIPYEQSLATNSSVKDIMKWKLIYKDSVGPNGIDLSISDEYNELLFEYGTKNSDQVYGGGSVVMAKNSNHPMWVPLFAWNKESFIDVVYAFWIGNTLRISTTNNTINYQVWAR